MQNLQLSADDIRRRKMQQFEQRKRMLEEIPKEQYDSNAHPRIDSKFKGYMDLLKKKLQKQGVGQLTEYYSSSFLQDLKEKRNISFSQDILEKMYKQYGLEEYASNFNKEVFDPTKARPQSQYYEEMYKRAIERS